MSNIVDMVSQKVPAFKLSVALSNR